VIEQRARVGQPVVRLAIAVEDAIERHLPVQGSGSKNDTHKDSETHWLNRVPSATRDS
jgi:hypothetical protein